jgi:hypothetical protein
MNASRVTRLLTISSLLGATALGTALLPASAGQAAPTVSASLAPSSASTTVAKAHATIKGSPGTFSPKAIKAKPKPFSSCTTKLADLTIANKSKNPKTITSGGSVFGVIPASSKVNICQYGPAGYQFVYGIVGSTSALTVTMR